MNKKKKVTSKNQLPGNKPRQKTNKPIRWQDQYKLTHSTILIIEETNAECGITTQTLNRNGFQQLLTTHSTQKFLSIIDQQQHRHDIDLIIIDMMTDDVDALALCEAIVQNSQLIDTPILLISPDVDCCDDVLSTALDAGANDVIFKPLQQHNVIPRILTLLRLKKERNDNHQRLQTFDIERADHLLMETRFKYVSNHDRLTGLCNRQRLEQAISVAILQSDLNGRQSSLLYIDINQFKDIVDLEGHGAGDRLLTTIANILRQHSSTNTTIARINSDEYALLFDDSTEKAAFSHAKNIRQKIDNLQFKIDNRRYHISASFGIVSIKPEIKTSSSEILACADKACYEAKRKGRNNIHVFNRKNNEFDLLREDAYWIPRIHSALENSRLRLLFQPVMAIDSNKINRFEALLRMVDNKNELIAPNNFIPVAERNGLMHKIDLWVVNRAFDMLATCLKANKDISFNINLSSHAFNEKNLLPLIKNKLATTKISPRRITFEITETAAVTNYKKVRTTLTTLREIGFKIALDDFGLGFNSLLHLKQLPFDYIKIDGHFITNLKNDSVDQALVKSITDISKKLGKKTIAEFVVNRETLELIKSYGVDYAQGYYIGKADDINKFKAITN